MEALRGRLAEANAHVAVLAESRDKALMESVHLTTTAAKLAATGHNATANATADDYHGQSVSRSIQANFPSGGGGGGSFQSDYSRRFVMPALSAAASGDIPYRASVAYGTAIGGGGSGVSGVSGGGDGGFGRGGGGGGGGGGCGFGGGGGAGGVGGYTYLTPQGSAYGGAALAPPPTHDHGHGSGSTGPNFSQGLNAARAEADRVVRVGPGRYCSPRHGLPCNSSIEDQKACR